MFTCSHVSTPLGSECAYCLSYFMKQLFGSIARGTENTGILVDFSCQAEAEVKEMISSMIY